MMSTKFLFVFLFSVTVTAINEEYFDEDSRCVWNCHREYTGLLKTTLSGRPCRIWRLNDIIDLSRDIFNPNNMRNYCRAVNNKALPWCYVEGDDPTEWEYCFHFYCRSASKSDKNLCRKEGFKQYEDKCYSVLPQPVTSFTQGEEICTGQGSQLSGLHSEDEAIFINSLSCLPKLVSARMENNTWKWSGEESMWGLQEDHWIWCIGRSYEGATGDCTSFIESKCLAKMNCDRSNELLYPVCVYTPEPTEIVVILDSITWESANAQCEESGRRMCSLEDFCNLPTVGKSNLTTYKSLLLPLEGDKWLPVADEYNEWVYAGNRKWESICKLHNKDNGPPPWGLDEAVCSNDTENEYAKYCSAIGEVICCESNNENKTSVVEEVPVYVQSRLQDNVPFYHFSLNENRTVREVREDREQWRNYGQVDGDVRKFTLLVKYAKDLAEDAIYFCVQNSIARVTLQTTRHLVSRTPCKKPWKFNFHLYAMLKKPRYGNFTKLLVITGGSKKKAHSRVALDSTRHREDGEESFNIFTSSHEVQIAAPAQSTCRGQIERIRSKIGVIHSPNYPSEYPKTDPPVNCGWRVIGAENHLVRLTFEAIDLKNSGNPEYFTTVKGYERFRTNRGEHLFNHNQTCKNERIEIQDPAGRRNEKNWVKYGVFCGDWAPDPFITTANAVSLRFYGSSSGPGRGFFLIYESIAPPNGMNSTKISDRKAGRLTWKNAKTWCLDKNKDLCLAKDICSYERPFFGVEKKNHWTPVLEEYNDWVQIGDVKGQTCERHNPLYGPPQWGVNEIECNETDPENKCSMKDILYCCDRIPARNTERLNKEQLPVGDMVTIKVYTTVQNGNTFYRYAREGVAADSINGTSIWIAGRRHVGDLTTIKFYTHYKPGHDKVIYFCYKPLVLAIGQLQTVYAMFTQPCHLKDWRLSFYLYTSDEQQEDTKKIYVGISTLYPYHSRAHFSSFPPLYRGLESFIIYAETPDFIPKSEFQNPNSTEGAIDECSVYPVDVTAPSILVSPGYPKHYQSKQNCKWKIRLSDDDIKLGVKLKITIEELHLEDQADYLRVYDVPLDFNFTDFNERDFSQEFTGNVFHVTMVTNNSFILFFESDYSIEKAGFKVIAEIINDKCGGTIADHGSTVTSTNYPKKYYPGLNCTWVVQAPNPGYGIEIQFGKLELRESQDCTKDYIAFGPRSDPTQYKHCGVRDELPRVQFNDSSIIVNFLTKNNAKGLRKGFLFNVFFWPRGNLAGVGIMGAKCGVQKIPPWGGGNAAARDRIVGGTEAIPGSWPWVVYLHGAACGGALLNSRWVLTASHCFAEKLPEKEGGGWTIKYPITNYTVIAGRHQKTAKSRKEQVFQVERIILHPKYDRKRIGAAGVTVPEGIPVNDIALIKLKQAAIASDTVSPACLPTQDAAAGETCVIAGWGARELLASINGAGENSLHYAHVHSLPNNLCNSYDALRNSVLDKMMCAGYPGGGVDSCQGDSGGPLMCKGPDRSYQIKGVVSWGRACGKSNQPGVYTRVWSYYDWISSFIHT